MENSAVSRALSLQLLQSWALSAVVIVTGVSMKFTNTSIFENSSEYTHTIIQQMNQNIDSYIDYMENIAYLISSNEDVQDYLFDDENR